MFNYTDPVGGGLLDELGGLTAYRVLVHDLDKKFGLLPGSNYVERDAFVELSGDSDSQVDTVSWLAFPRTATVSNAQIDANRFDFQDEYVEWRVDRNQAGGIKVITFTTEFPEYYVALAQVGVTALVRGIQETLPGTNPTQQELFGPSFDATAATPRARGARFLNNAPNNPWNNGQKGILFLTQQFNTMNALFNLAAACSVIRPDLEPSAVCGKVGGACGSERNSDPRVCQACQNLARAGRGLTLDDPAGIRLLALGGVWELSGQAIDINDPGSNQGAWSIDRNGRRANLNVTTDLSLGGDPITSGAQVAAVLTVGADVISSPEDLLPEWARTGQEGTRI
jgi:hypothetical protein